ncbi:DNA-binding response regulator [Flavobacterium sp. WLB]|uniref:LytR/AlgR family response regulator transcription factor n=1 Tax=unclassified Flavobacterium TaxID=196869 RepID=UPI0006ABECE4|nr:MULTISPECIES: LytTR family DNA-binding domain-containing protein [unclassified Flavobacterium]KOP35855.1 LytTR family transcriptional regulator [Flavobacterium sp. VMW]OWU89534.1 LytTR family transcriptional regulator [Flavobacterium sp. NLM]PUU71767.1 DNA-binding response regulator [Flavobacterium sp. WLB]
MIKAIALDDEPLALEILQSLCDTIDYIELNKTFTKSDEAFKYLKKYPVDLLFLDINMPSISGLDFYKKLPHKTMVIFTTAYSEFAVEGFTLSATDYLLKPISLSRFQQAAEKAFSQWKLQNQNIKQQYLFIRADYSLIKILFSDILYIEGLDDYLKIHIQNQKTVVARMTLKAILQKLPETEFLRVHRSFIIPISKISKIRNKIIFIGQAEIPISVSYEEAFSKLFDQK